MMACWLFTPLFTGGLNISTFAPRKCTKGYSRRKISRLCDGNACLCVREYSPWQMALHLRAVAKFSSSRSKSDCVRKQSETE